MCDMVVVNKNVFTYGMGDIEHLNCKIIYDEYNYILIKYNTYIHTFNIIIKIMIIFVICFWYWFF